MSHEVQTEPKDRAPEMWLDICSGYLDIKLIQYIKQVLHTWLIFVISTHTWPIFVHLFLQLYFWPMNECIFRHSHPWNNSVFITFCFSLALGLLFRRIMADLAIWPQIPNKSGYTKTLYTFFFKNVCLQMRMLNVQAGQPSYRNISCSTTKPKTAHLSNNRHCLCLGKIIHNPHT